jgi:hypothetical protein
MANKFTFVTPEEEDEIFDDLNDVEEDPDEGKPVIAKVTENKRHQVLGAWNR